MLKPTDRQRSERYTGRKAVHQLVNKANRPAGGTEENICKVNILASFRDTYPLSTSS